MSYNGSGTFNINTTGQPVVAGTVITATAFNLLTADLATGLTTAITKDGQTATTARIPFAQGINSTLVTDATNTTSGSIITDGGVGIAKALYVGTTANVGGTTDSSSISTGSIITAGGVGIAKNLYVGGTLNVTGATSFTNPVINNIKMGYTTTATAAGTTTLTVASNYRQFFTGTLAQTIVLPVTSTLVTGIAYEIENNSTGTLTVNSSGGNLVGTIPSGVCAHAVCIGTTLTTAADWDWDYISTSTITGTGANVLATSPTLVTPALGTPSALVLTNATGLPQAGLGTNVVGNGPIFSAYNDADQSISNTTTTKITFNTENFDSNSNFASSRFTPTVAGYYVFTNLLFIGNYTNTGTNELEPTLYKNGSGAGSSFIGYGQNVLLGTAGGIGHNLYLNSTFGPVYANGSTDYFEIYFTHNTGSSRNVLANSGFSGWMVRSA
jgi:hypothetical protein